MCAEELRNIEEKVYLIVMISIETFNSILSTASMKYLEEEDSEATLGLEFVDPDGEAHVMEIRLRKYEDYWRVTEILNLGDIWYQLAL